MFAVRFAASRSVVTTVYPAAFSRIFCGDNVAEFEYEIEPEFDDKFVADFVVRQVVEFTVRTGAVVLTFA